MSLQYKIVNHVLAQNEWMKDELIEFKNKIIQLQVEPFILQFKVNDLGQFNERNLGICFGEKISIRTGRIAIRKVK